MFTSKLIALKLVMTFATQNDDKNAPKYCRVSSIKNGIATPNIINPPSFAIAMPSTLFDEREMMSSDMITPIGAVNVDKTTFDNMLISVSEKKSNTTIENTVDTPAEKPSLDSK